MHKREKQRQAHFTVWAVAKTEYSYWIRSTKLLMIILLVCYIRQQLVQPLLELTELTDGKLQVLEPTVALLGSCPMMLLLPLLFLLLMGDFPRMDDSIRFVLPRVGRRTWYLGQLLFSFLASVTILGGFCMFTTIWCIGRLSWNHGMWSDAVTKYYQEVQSDFKFNLITGEIYNQVTPIYAFLHSVFLVLALMLALSALLLLFGVLQKKVAGLTICGFWVAIGNGLAVFQSEPFMWLFPIANTQIRLRYGVLFREEQMPLWGSYLYFVVVLFGAIVLGWYFGCNRRRV